MDTVPAEILRQILLHVHKSSLADCRLVYRTFSALAFPIQFSFIPQWLDFKTSHCAIVALAQDAFNRPAVMWSPWAMEPDGPVEQVWMEIVWKLLMKSEPPRAAAPAALLEQANGLPDVARESHETIGEGIPSLDVLANTGNGEKVVALTSANFSQLSGREEMTENRLRTGQNRYLLHRDYASNVAELFRPGGAKPLPF